MGRPTGSEVVEATELARTVARMRTSIGGHEGGIENKARALLRHISAVAIRFPFFTAAPGRLMHNRKGPRLNLITVHEQVLTSVEGGR